MSAPHAIPSPAEPHDAPWYERAFGAGYLDLYSHRDLADAVRAVQFLRREMGLREGMRLLDLCCGPGRHLALLAPELGWAVGLDLSRVLLSRAREHCQATLAARPDGARHHCGLVEADMRCLPFAAGSFDAVANLFTSFGYFDSEEENLAVLGEVARTLRPGGLFALDHINRRHLETFLQATSERHCDRGIRVVERRRFDPASGRIEKTVHWHDATGETDRWTESVRVYGRDDLACALESRGLRELRFFGDYDGSPLAEESPRMIILARKEG